MLRLDRIITTYTPYSRREAAALIKKGLVSANGAVCRDPAAKFDLLTLALQIQGERIPLRPVNTLMLHKPEGYISATEDARAQSVLALIAPEDLYPLPFPAGRLDKDVTGLLILTSDGDLCHRIISPQKEIYKTYEMQVDGVLEPADAEQLARGLILQSGESFRPACLTILESGAVSHAHLAICEGKYHQVKRMMAALGKSVISLKRLAIGGLALDDSLLPGEYKRLTDEEIALIFKG